MEGEGRGVTGTHGDIISKEAMGIFGSLAPARVAQDGSEDGRRVCLSRGRGCRGKVKRIIIIYIIWIFQGTYALIRGSTGAMGVRLWNQVNQGVYFPDGRSMGTEKKGWVISKE